VDRDQGLRLRVDNDITRTPYVDEVATISAPFVVGAYGPPYSGAWRGAIDEVSLWRRSLSDAELDAVAAGRPFAEWP
jgi:hypothetical protein